MIERGVKIVCVCVSVLIAIPFVVLVGFWGASFLIDRYTIYKLHKAAPDAYQYDYQCYETENGAYQADFYKFSECNEDFIKDWETEASDEFIFKFCSINAGLFRPVIIINTSAKCATLEYHCTLWE